MNKAKRLIPFSLIALALSLFGCGGGASSSASSSSSEQSASSSVSSSEASSSESKSESASSSVESSVSSSSASSSLTSSASSSPYDRSPRDEDKAGNQIYLNHIGDIDSVWESYRGDGQTIAIIDSGFDYEHPEFYFEDGSSKIVDTSAFFYLENGTVKKEVGVDKVGIAGGDSHGTFCATVAAGSVTGSGTTGIAPNAKLMLLKTDKTPKAISAAFRYAADQGVKVLTISIGSYNGYEGDLVDDGSDLTTVFSEPLRYAHEKGMVICSAAGNGGECGKPTEYTYPGASDYVIGCGGLAHNSTSKAWGGSSYNYSKAYQFCDVFAPAENLYSGCSYYDGSGNHVLYDGGWNGTSFASPIVAGAAALYFQKNPSATNEDFEVALFRSAVAFGNEAQTGYGRLDVAGLLSYEKDPSSVWTIHFESASWWDADGAKTAVFAWNYGNTMANADYPGEMLTYGSGGSSIELDTAKYDCLVFSRVSPQGEFWGAQTIDVALSSLRDEATYSIASTSAKWVSDGAYVEGNIL